MPAHVIQEQADQVLQKSLHIVHHLLVYGKQNEPHALSPFARINYSDFSLSNTKALSHKAFVNR